MAGPLGASPGIIVGVGVGTAAAAAIEPIVEPAKQKAWDQNRNRILDAGTLARLAAQGGITLESAKTTGHLHGLTDDKMDALVYLAQTVPGVSEALTLFRRQQAIGNDFSGLLDHAIVKSGIDPRYSDAIKELVGTILSPSEIANAVQQGHLANPGILPDLATNVTPAPGSVAPATVDGQPPSSIPLTQIGINPVTQAEGSGTSFEQLQVLANLAGLPPGQHELLEMWNRGLIDEASVDAGIREGHTKTKWIGPFKRLRWAVLSPLQYVEARVRGWITNEQLYAGGSLSGYTPAQLDLLHSTHGRPISARSVARGLARGGKRLDPVADFTGANPVAADGSAVPPIPDALFRSMQQSNIQQQWYDLERRDIVNYPSLFMLNHLAKADPAYIPRAVTILGYLIYDPIDIAAIEAFWRSTPTTATQKKQTLAHLTGEYLSGAMSAAALTTALQGLGYTAQQAADEIALAEFNASKAVRTKATTAIGKRFIALQLTEAEARADMQALGWPTGAVDKFVAGWNAERDDEGTTLTQKQVLTAYKKSTITPADALARLQVLGSSAADAQILLDSQ